MRFIAIEGPDGAGKSTLAAALADRFRTRGHAVCQVRDPGDTDLGQSLRQWILSPPDDYALAPIAELHLFLAARAQLAHEVILPALQAGAIVISDRFWLSTLAYQGSVPDIANAMDQSFLRRLAASGAGEAVPTHWLILDLPLREAEKRTGGARDRIEKRGEAYYLEVRKKFREEANRLPRGRVLFLDGSRPPPEVAQTAWEFASD